VKFEEFERRARRAFGEIPEEFRRGVDGLTVLREAVPHPTLPDVYTMGHCQTEEHPSDYGGPDTTRSVIALHWGSFRELAHKDPDFDWDEELWETLTHELRHHLESLARDDDLEQTDYAADELFKRDDGRPFDPWYYQKGDDLGGGVFDVEGDVYLEQPWSDEDFGRAEAIDFHWRGRSYRLERPPDLGDVHFVRVLGPDFEDDPLELVLTRRRRALESLAGLLRSRAPRVHQSEAEVRRVDDG
jgi:predicted Zn-dependent protease with MMP-like domain